jgi:hypothetical protein
MQSVVHILMGIALALAKALARLRQRVREPQWLPPELKGQALVFAEKTFRTRAPYNLIARIDRAYGDATKLVLLELKTRSSQQIYLSDIIELSAQRAAIQFSTHFHVHTHGFILLRRPTTPHHVIHKVPLYTEQEVTALAKRRQLIMRGIIEPRGPERAELCKHCEYQVECRAQTPIAPKAATLPTPLTQKAKQIAHLPRSGRNDPQPEPRPR